MPEGSEPVNRGNKKVDFLRRKRWSGLQNRSGDEMG